MDVETALGTAVRGTSRGRPEGTSPTPVKGRPEGTSPTPAPSSVEHALKGVLLLFMLLTAAGSASAGERYAVVVTGASGGAQYAQQYDTWRTSLVTILHESWNYPDDHVFVLGEKESDGVAQATRDNVRRVLGDVRARATKDDVVLVML